MTTPGSTRSFQPPLLATAVAVVLAGSLTACSGDGDAPVSKDRTPQEVFELAQSKLADAASVDVALETKDLPQGVAGLVKADGTATDQPAFDGSITVMVAGQQPVVPVRAIGDTVWATLPFATTWSQIDPAEYGAPNPAALIDDETGFGSLLALPTDIKEGKSVRGGSDNSEVLTTYTASVPGEAVKKVMPDAEAAAPFAGEFLINAEGELREMSLTGAFYSGKPSLTYTLDFSRYSDTAQEIAQP